MMLLWKRLMLVVPAVLCCRAAYAQVAWSDLTPAPGAHVVYVSSSSGSDSNPGTQGLPFRTLARGYAALSDGHPDQLLLKAGDAWDESFPSPWAKSSGSSTSYMVIGAYGLAPGVARPKIRVSSTVLYGGVADKTGLAVVDLDCAASVPGSNYAGISFFQGWRHVLLEGCSFVGFPVNVVFQEIGPGRLSDIRINRCVIADSTDVGSGHSQGIFWGSVDGGVISGCVLDRNATNRADMFCHNAYIHQSAGQTVFEWNITARATSHGVQQRSGGTMIGNVAIQNPIGLFQGDDTSWGGNGAASVFEDNVALDSRDISATDPRGLGFELQCTPGTVIRRNVAAHQVSGTANTDAFSVRGLTAEISDNVVYNWKLPGTYWGTGFHWNAAPSGVFRRNQVYQPGDSLIFQGWFPVNAGGNRYWSGNAAPFWNASVHLAWPAYGGAEAGSVFADPGPRDVRIAAYMTHLKQAGDVPEFMAEARKLARNYDRPEFQAPALVGWVQAAFGVGRCYADFDGSGALNVNDFNAFLNAFAVGDPVANCDGSTAGPSLNVNDFNCFLNAFAVGCG